MCDDADTAQEYERKALEAALNEARKKSEMPAGTTGDCDMCGNWSGRLVYGACAPCRDKYKLP